MQFIFSFLEEKKLSCPERLLSRPFRRKERSVMDLKPLEKKVWLSSPTMHGEELAYVTEAYNTNWMSTVGKNINEVERIVAEKMGCGYAVALSSGTAALHLCMKLAGM